MGRRTGDVIAGRYRLDRILGQGGQGAVWRADHVTLGSPVAVKLLAQSVVENADAVARFLREAQSAAALRSPHVVQILDHGMDGAVPYIAMELLEGESLQQRLDKERILSPAQTIRILSHVCRAMGRAHDAGIVHRDLKPANIFLVRNDDEEIAKVLDFGIAKVQTPTGVAASSQTKTGALLGTPFYMSPEQARGKTVDARSDLWSVAIIAFECLVGRVPFTGDSIGDLVIEICTDPIAKPSFMGAVPPGFDQWFERATQRDPGRRFQTAREFADSLKAALDRHAVDPLVGSTVQGLGPRADAPTVAAGEVSQPGLRSLFTTGMEEAATATNESGSGAGAVVRVSQPRIEPATVLSSVTVTDGSARTPDPPRSRWPVLAIVAVLGAAAALAFALRSPAPSSLEHSTSVQAPTPSPSTGSAAATEPPSTVVVSPVPAVPPEPAASATPTTSATAAPLRSAVARGGSRPPAAKAPATGAPAPATAATVAPGRPKEDLGL